MIVILQANDLQAFLDEQRNEILRQMNLVENRVNNNIDAMGGLIVATAKEVIDSIVVQLNRACDEIAAKMEAGTVTVADLEPLRAVATKVDELAPEVPEDETPVEPMPEPTPAEPEGTPEDPNPGQIGG